MAGDPAHDRDAALPLDADRFVWPPRRPAQSFQGGASDAVPTGQPARSAAHAIPPWRAALTQIERTWLGLVSLPWAIRAAEAGWRLDDADAYCWRCGRTVGPFEVTPVESPEPGCTGCRGKRLAWDRFIRAGEYTGELRRAIQEVKFGRWRSLGDSLGRELGLALARELSWAGRSHGPVVLVPVPASTRRRLRSGIDHTQVLVRAVRKMIGGRIMRPVWRRHGPSQLQVPPSERARNAARAFVPVHETVMGRLGLAGRVPRPPAGATVIVIDDVRTTGSTMMAACRAVRAAFRHGMGRTTGSPRQGRSSGLVAGGDLVVWAAVVGVTPEPGERGPGEDLGDSLTEQMGLEA
ncbi:MAG: hypothetical protein AMXMBFR58_05560 [Phycisphaerae bacterium]